MIGLGLRQLQDTLNHRADTIQKEFIAVSDRLRAIGLQLVESRGEEHERLLAEQDELRGRQVVVAAEVNRWRERARDLALQADEGALRRRLQALLEEGDEALRAAVERTLQALDAPDALSAGTGPIGYGGQPLTGAARLIERARGEYDLRGADPAPRQRAAVEFAQRRGMAQDEAALAEIEGALDDPDPIVREVALLTLIQLHRFRALNLADLQAAHESVKRLARINSPAVIPVLIEILGLPRSGFVNGQEERNGASRMLALTRLIEWHTAAAQAAVRARQFDPDPRIVRVALRALELFPGQWSGPLPRASSVAG